MANTPNRESIKKDANSGAYEPDVVEYKELIKELIRMDVPILEVGSSSIGKSYSIRQFAEDAGVKAEFLFVGTEKSEFIEGIPNLKVVPGQAKFSYLKPYWFPDKEEIRSKLIRGKNQLDSLSSTTISTAGFNTFGELWNAAKEDYSKFETVKTELLKFKRSEETLKALKEDLKRIKDERMKAGMPEAEASSGDIKPGKYEYEDALLYLSTLDGYGNFWLILDEIDKVEKMDKDKYAPLLHIVRERELKGWKLSGMRTYPEYDIKYVENMPDRIDRLNAALMNPDVDVTDTRIIAIANDLQVMEEESPALYRRFVKIIIRSSLYDEKKIETTMPDITKGAVGFDWANFYEEKRQNIHNCIVLKEVGVPGEKQKAQKQGAVAGIQYSGDSILKQMAYIETDKCGNALDEMNLQWTLGFFPDILFPMADTSINGPMFITNKFISNFNASPLPYKTLISKIIQDNFDRKYWVPLMECVYDKIVTKTVAVTAKSGSPIETEVETLYEKVGLTPGKFNSAGPTQAEALLKAYQNKLDFSTGKFKDALEYDQSGSSAINDKTLAGLKASTTQLSVDAIVFGNFLYQKSLIGSKPTELTRMLISSVPFMQTKYICSTPYISFKQAEHLIALHDNGLSVFVEKVSGKKFDEASAKDSVASVFGMIEPYKPFVVKYGMGAVGQDGEDILNSNYKALIPRMKEVVEGIIANNPVIVDDALAKNISPKDAKLKEKYFNSLASVKLIEKEVHQNLTYDVFPMALKSLEVDGFTTELRNEIDYYCASFPETMKILAENYLKQDDANQKALADHILTETDKALANGTGTEIDKYSKVTANP